MYYNILYSTKDSLLDNTIIALTQSEFDKFIEYYENGENNVFLNATNNYIKDISEISVFDTSKMPKDLSKKQVFKSIEKTKESNNWHWIFLAKELFPSFGEDVTFDKITVPWGGKRGLNSQPIEVIHALKREFKSNDKTEEKSNLPFNQTQQIKMSEKQNEAIKVLSKYKNEAKLLTNFPTAEIWKSKVLTSLEIYLHKDASLFNTFKKFSFTKYETIALPPPPRGLIRLNNTKQVSVFDKEKIKDVGHLLDSLIDTIKTHGVINEVKENKTISNTTKNLTEVFIVHGHDEIAINEVARFVTNIGLKPIILREQVSRGKTIIEKIEEYTNVGFGIVLYTACDRGYKSGKESEIKNRARQNVVFEHGFLNGKIGRENVLALVKGEIEIPNDISGIVFTAMDSAHGWKIKVGKELKKAGYNIDLNNI